MTGLLPSREDDYRVTPEMVRSAELFSFVFGDLAQRLKEREALEATFEALIEEGTTAALTQIATNVAPQLADLQDDILAAQAEIEAILGTGEISPFVKVNILPAQDDAAILAALGIPALFDAVRSEIMGGAPAAALDTIYELAERLAEDGDAIAAINTAIATKLNASAVSAWVLGNLLAAGDKATARAVLGIVMDDADKTKLNGIAAGANATPTLSDADITAGTGTTPGSITAAQAKLAAQTHGTITPAAGDVVTFSMLPGTSDDVATASNNAWPAPPWGWAKGSGQTAGVLKLRCILSGTIRIKYQHYDSSNYYSPQTRLSKNGSTIDTHTGSGGTLIEVTLDVPITAGDELALSIITTGGPGNGGNAKLRNVRICANKACIPVI